MIEKGQVLVDGFPVKKVETRVKQSSSLKLVNNRDDWVGRAARKIWPFLQRGWLTPENRVAVDVGASTGGFTQALLKKSARLVYAVDVGYGQLDYSIQQDDRVRQLDRYNFRYAVAEDFQPAAEIFTMDVSFISTTMLIAPLKKIIVPNSSGMVLIKPQFEATRREAGDGIIRSKNKRVEIVERVLQGWRREGFEVVECEPSPLVGSSGNQEFVALFKFLL